MQLNSEALAWSGLCQALFQSTEFPNSRLMRHKDVPMDLCTNRQPQPISRREMLQTAACGFGFLAFQGISNAASSRILLPDDDPFAPKRTHFEPKAKRVIFLCMAGGPSHVDTFDYKPELSTMEGKSYRRNAKLLPSPWKFRQRGESGLWISDLFPEVGTHADEMTLLRSMKAAIPAHSRQRCTCIRVHSSSFAHRWAHGPFTAWEP